MVGNEFRKLVGQGGRWAGGLKLLWAPRLRQALPLAVSLHCSPVAATATENMVSPNAGHYTKNQSTTKFTDRIT